MNQNKITYSGSDVLALFSKLEKKLESLTCFVRDCCAKVPINIGRGLGLYRRFSGNKWQFKTLLQGSNITLTETTEEIIISSTSSFSCSQVNDCLGISNIGDINKFLNQQGDFINITPFDCSDLAYCSTSNLQEGSRLYFTDNRAISALTGQNISLFTNNVGYLTSSSLTPYLTISSASSTYYPLSNPSNYITSSALSPYLLSSVAAITYQPIGSYLTTISGLNISLLNNDANYLTSSTASSTYEPIITPGTTLQYYRGDKTFQTLDKSTVGLSNVDNTSDANKPVSTATQTALNLKADKTGVLQLVGEYNTNTTLTGTIAETSIGYVLIPANTYGAGKTAWVDSLLLRAIGTSTIVTRMRISTSATPVIASATLLATNNIPNTIQYAPFVRTNIHVDSATSTKLYGVSTAVIQDNANTSNISDLNIDWTVDQYIHVSAQLIASGDSITLHKLRLYK